MTDNPRHGNRDPRQASEAARRVYWPAFESRIGGVG